MASNTISGIVYSRKMRVTNVAYAVGMANGCDVKVYAAHSLPEIKVGCRYSIELVERHGLSYIVSARDASEIF